MVNINWCMIICIFDRMKRSLPDAEETQEAEESSGLFVTNAFLIKLYREEGKNWKACRLRRSDHKQYSKLQAI